LYISPTAEISLKFGDEVVKLLGIDIDYQLNFNSHIKNICRKSSQQLNVLKRIGCFLSKLNKLTIFHTFILSNFLQSLKTTKSCKTRW
jgi:hypothetical protein